MRYEDVPNRMYDVLDFVLKGWFPELKGAKIMVVFDRQLSRSGGKITLASIRKANDLQRYLTASRKALSGYDYILVLDKVAWRRAGKENRIRIIRHELRHTQVHMSTSPYGLRGHTVEDFYSEIKLNKHDPKWAQKLAGTVEAVYRMRREKEKMQRKMKGGEE